MIPKPEILKEEVKEFIDVVYYLINAANFYNIFYKLYEFYSQPFQPEMITEYFEGWQCQKESSPVYWYNGKTSFTLEIDKYLGLHISKYLPKTLSQFITNCIQANINLTWKEPIEVRK